MKKRNASTAGTGAPMAGVERLWPVMFASAKRSGFIVAASGVLILAAVSLGLNNRLLWVKVILAWLLGFTDPSDLGPSPLSLDLAGILASLIAVGGATAIHPALGIGMLAGLRTWLDGYTFPVENTYFLWAVLLIFAVWGVRAVLRGEGLRMSGATACLGVFLLWSLLPTLASIHYLNSYRTMLVWTGGFFLLLLTQNVARNPAVARTVLWCVAGVLAAQSVFAIMQYEYILPYLRELLNARPEIRSQFFPDWTPELVRRFNVNRAFGTVLFPNALGAFIILLLPHAALECVERLRGLRELLRREAGASAARAALLGGGVWGVCVVVLFIVLQFPVTYDTSFVTGVETVHWFSSIYLLSAFAAAVSLGPAAVVYRVALRRGLVAAWAVASAALYAMATLAGSIALVLTFSRGAFLALFVAVLLGAAVYRWPAARLPRMLRGAGLSTAVLLCLACGGVLATHGAWGQEGPDVAPPAAEQGATPAGAPMDISITREGTGAELANVESFRLRFTYWRVSLRMFRDFLWLGVGPGAYEWGYAPYQRLGDGDVHEAHNGYLQAFCETGLPGGLLWLLFWGVALLGAALQIVRTEDRVLRRWRLGLFVGLLAFAGHAAIDINFQQPSLMFFAMLMLGVLVSQNRVEAAGAEGGMATVGAVQRYALLPLLIIAALALGLSVPYFTQRVCLSRLKLIDIAGARELEHRLEVGRHFFEQVVDGAIHKKMDNVQPIPVRSARMLIRNPEAFRDLGVYYVRQPSGWRRLNPGEAIRDDAVLAVTKPWNAYGAALAGAQQWLAELERIDRRFPHDPALAKHLSEWYEMLSKKVIRPRHEDLMVQYAGRSAQWAEAAISRNRMHADVWVTAGLAYWRLANVDKSAQRGAMFEKAIAYFEKAPPLAPTMPQYLAVVAYGLRELAKGYDQPATQGRREELLRLAGVYHSRARALYEERAQLGLPYMPSFYGAPEENPDQ